jgi:hypothetical protein
MTPERTRLLAENQALYDQIAAAKARRAEVQAELAKLDAEPDWEAWRPALEAFYDARGGYEGVATPLDHHDIRLVRGLIAAAPLIPRDAGQSATTEALAAMEVARRAIEMQRSYGCGRCNGDCGSANPPVLACPMQVAHEALARLTAAIRALAAQQPSGAMTGE